jgi:hypothetical protein
MIMFTTLPVFLVLLAVIASAGADAPEISSRTAEVSGVFGSAFANSRTGDTPIRTGTTIRPESGAAVDIYFGSEAGVIRLTQNTMLRIERLADTNGQAGVGSRYQIKTAVGVAGLGSAAFRLTTPPALNRGNAFLAAAISQRFLSARLPDSTQRRARCNEAR